MVRRIVSPPRTSPERMLPTLVPLSNFDGALSSRQGQLLPIAAQLQTIGYPPSIAVTLPPARAKCPQGDRQLLGGKAVGPVTPRTGHYQFELPFLKVDVVKRGANIRNARMHGGRAPTVKTGWF